MNSDALKTARRESAKFSNEFLQNVVEGRVDGHSIIRKFGAYSAVPTSPTIIAGGAVYPTPTALTSLEVLSNDNTNDKAGQAGAQIVRIMGLGTGWTEISEDITLNGTTAVPLVNQYYRVYRMYIVQSGTYATTSAASHNSTITLRVASAGATWAVIEKEGTIGHGQTKIGAYTIPKGKTGYLLSDHISVEVTKAAKILRFVRENCDDVTTPYTGVMRVQDILRSATGQVSHDGIPVGPFVGPCDIGYFAEAATGTAAVECDFFILLVDN